MKSFLLIMVKLFYCKLMLFFPYVIIKRIIYFSQLNFMFIFWNISRIYAFFFSIQNIKSNCYIIFLNSFPVIFFWCIIFFFPVKFFYKRFNFNFFIISCDCYSVLKTTVIFLLMRFIVAFLFLSSQENLCMIHHHL